MFVLAVSMRLNAVCAVFFCCDLIFFRSDFLFVFPAWTVICFALRAFFVCPRLFCRVAARLKSCSFFDRNLAIELTALLCVLLFVVSASSTTLALCTLIVPCFGVCSGSNFGTSGATVLIGSTNCNATYHDSFQPNSIVSELSLVLCRNVIVSCSSWIQPPQCCIFVALARVSVRFCFGVVCS